MSNRYFNNYDRKATPAQATGSGGVGLLGALFLVFLVLKLIHVIAWSWWWVTAPLWGPVVLAILGFVLYLFISWMIDKRKKDKARKARRERDMNRPT